MIPFINTQTALTTIYLFRLANVSLNTAFTNNDSATTLKTLIDNNEDNYYMQELTAYRVGDEEFVLNINYNEILKYNYAVITLLQDNSTYYYFFYIDSYKAVAVNKSSISLTLDTLTTYYKEMKENGVKGSLERAHLPSFITLDRTGEGTKNIINPEILTAEDTTENSYIVRDTSYIEGEARYLVVVCNLNNTLDPENYECCYYDGASASGLNNNQTILNFSCIMTTRGGGYEYSGIFRFISPNDPEYDGTDESNKYGLYLVIETNGNDTYTGTGTAPVGLRASTCVVNNGVETPYTILIFDREKCDFAKFVQFNSGFLDYVEQVFFLPPIYNHYLETETLDENLGHMYFSPEAGKTTITIEDEELGEAQVINTDNIPDSVFSPLTDVTYGIPYDIGFVVKNLNFFRITTNLFNNKMLINELTSKMYSLREERDNPPTRSYEYEPKLYAYPYQYNLVDFISTTITIKYNDYPLMQMIEGEDSKYEWVFDNAGACTLAIDYYSTSPMAYGDFVCNKYFINYDNLDTSSTINSYGGHELYLNKYCFAYNSGCADLIEYDFAQTKWDTYKQYNKAMIDSNIAWSTASGITNTISNLLGSALGAYGISQSAGVETNPVIEWHTDRRRKTGGYEEVVGYEETPFMNPSSFISSGLTATKQLGGAVNQVLGMVQQYQQKSLNEASMRRQPAQLQGNAKGGSKLQFMFNQTGNNTADIPTAVEYTLGVDNDNLKMLENRFYLYGYSTPYSIDTKDNDDLFEYVFDSRKYFNYVKFSEVDFWSQNLPIPYMNDMINRLTAGTTFYHINEYYTYDTKVVNIQTSEYEKPLILSEE